jgi:hypothetical protein
MSDVLFADTLAADFGGFIKLVDMHSTTAGPCTLAWDTVTKTLTFTGVDTVPGPAVLWQQTATQTYYKLYSGNPLNWIIIYVDGTLGASDSLTFNTDFAEDEDAQQSILKLCSVSWDLLDEALTHRNDLRRFNTADNRVALEEEHDSAGGHTKVLQNQFKVAMAGANALFGSAVATGVYGAGAIGVRGVGVTGVYCDGSLGINQACTAAAVAEDGHICIRLAAGVIATINVKTIP